MRLSPSRLAGLPMDGSPTLTCPQQRLSAVCWTTVAILTTFLCFTQLGMMLSLTAGRIGIAAVAPVSFLLAAWVGHWLARVTGLTGRARLWPQGFALAVLAVSLLVASWYFDLSVDGQWYHQTAILAIAHDWNPLTDPLRHFYSNLDLSLRHYPKGPWYVAAAVYNTTGQIEWGKCQDVIAFLATGLAVFAAGLDWGLTRARGAVLAAVVALNPVVTSALVAYMVDVILASFVAITLAALFSGFRRARPVVIVTGVAAAIFAINAKLTGLVYVSILLAGGGLWVLLRRRRDVRSYVGLAALTLALGVLIFGVNPYVTNTIYRGNPFYPLKGTKEWPSLTAQGTEGIEIYETPKNLIGRNRLVRFAYATFGRPGNAPYNGDEMNGEAELMWPFTARLADFRFYIYQETRVAGFGPYFSGAILFLFGLSVWIFWRQPRARAALALTTLTIAGSSLLSVHMWWTRYSPQVWILATVPLAFGFWKPVSKRMLAATWAVAVVLLINAAIVGGIRMGWETQHSQAMREQLSEIRQSGREIEVSMRFYFDSVPERLRNWGIPFRVLGPGEITGRNGTSMVGLVEGYPDFIAAHYRYVSQPAP